MTIRDVPLPFDHPAEEPPRPWHDVPPPDDEDAPDEELLP